MSCRLNLDQVESSRIYLLFVVAPQTGQIVFGRQLSKTRVYCWYLHIVYLVQHFVHLFQLVRLLLVHGLLGAKRVFQRFDAEFDLCQIALYAFLLLLVRIEVFSTHELEFSFKRTIVSRELSTNIRERDDI